MIYSTSKIKEASHLAQTSIKKDSVAVDLFNRDNTGYGTLASSRCLKSRVISTSVVLFTTSSIRSSETSRSMINDDGSLMMVDQ